MQHIFTSKARAFAVALLLVLTALGIRAQVGNTGNVDPKSVNVSAMSDQQVLTLMREIEKRGLSQSEAIALGRARGMSQNQLDELLKRMNELKMKKMATGEEGDALELTKQGSDEELLSKKKAIDSTKVDTRIFGFDFFNNDKLTFEPNIKVPVSPSYVVGPGDEVLIDVWGQSQKNYELKIDRNGNINIPDVGPINIGNLTLEKASGKIIQRLSSIYRDLGSSSPKTFASIYLGAVKPIKVNVVGEVFTPGSYTLPGTASVFNALYLAGGPSKNGSFRDIQVIRDGKIMERLDVYDFLINGNGMVNVPLRDNDVIMVPTYLNRVRVGGEFKRNGIFEAKDGENIADLVRFAGGFTENAYTQRIELYRNTNKQKQFKSITDTEFENNVLLRGDSIFAGLILERFENKVAIEGAVFRPGNYELTDGLKLSGLIDLADGLREDAFMNRGLITRLNKDLTLSNMSFSVADVVNGSADFDLSREDIVTISSISDLRAIQTVNIAGEIQLPGEFDFRQHMTLSDLIFMAGGLLESATESSIEIARRLSYEEANAMGSRMAHVYQFSVSRDLKLLGDDSKFELKPFDQVYVRRAPSYSEWGVVTIKGEVRYAGDYSLTSKGERVSDVIKRAGGLAPDAFPESAMLTRKIDISPKVKRLREELMLKDSTLSFSDLDFDVVGVNLKKIIDNPGGKDDIYMRPGDELIIPREMQTVRISGEVLNPLSVTYQRGAGIRNYLDQAGGFGNKAKTGRIYVIHANGVASSTKHFFVFRRYPRISAGSEIVVPQKPEREPMSAAAWIAIAGSLASIALTISTIASLNN
jgi:protein involved in polysaccharide export with SLBB domain